MQKYTFFLRSFYIFHFRSTLNRRNYQKPRPPPLPLARHLSVTSSHNHNHSNLIGHLNDPIRGGIGIGGGDSSSLSSSFAQLQMSPGPSPEVTSLQLNTQKNHAFLLNKLRILLGKSPEKVKKKMQTCKIRCLKNIARK